VFNKVPRHEDIYCLIKHHAMNTYWGSGGIAPHILNLGTRWRWVVSFTPRPLYPLGRAPRYPLDRVWVYLRPGLETVVAKINHPSPCRESNPCRPSNSLVSVLTELLSIVWSVPNLHAVVISCLQFRITPLQELVNSRRCSLNPRAGSLPHSAPQFSIVGRDTISTVWRENPF
jgi:hypothetical protein